MSAGKNPYVVEVKASGLIDSACAGHLKWQEFVRDYTPRMLDMSIIKYEEQNESSRGKLQDALRKKFEFVENEVIDDSMDKMIKMWLRKDRERMKRLHGGKTKAPTKINPEQWNALKKYWELSSSKMKSESMTNSRSKVAYNPRVGRRGYGGKHAKLVRNLHF